ncbi:DUF5050 domain-containing protein [Clostridium sp. OS1-26]|uniref:DUF5050 domain-containing protein n=1 Tax=Clostridium sp. OS1-26 TaxID=3070681 RepID=UPI0027E1975F|nr:DUF5050 domain-containing protein [Clostridium sp. OS1-26]WML35450.1 DUF5050 domain-containing protein [Clostridium sp. OS1-26]
MKKTKMLLLAVAVALGTSSAVYAFPANKEVLIIGNRAFDVSSNTSDINSLTGRFSDPDFANYVANNMNNMYYVKSDSSGTPTIVKDVFNGQTMGEADLVNKTGGRINYYQGNSTAVSDYWVNQNNQYKSSSDIGQGSNNTQNQYITLEIDSKNVAGSLYLYTFKVDQVVGVPGAAYYSIGAAGTNVSPFKTNLSYMIDTSTFVSNSSAVIPLYIYSSDMRTKIADASLKASDLLTSTTSSAAISGFAVKTIKFNTVSNPITPILSRYVVLGNTSNGGYLDCDTNYIYYVNTGDGNKIYKKNEAGTENYSICDDNSGYITVYGDWIYYCNYSDSGKIYKVKNDGTQRQKISDNKGTYLNVLDDKVYYVNASDRGRIYSLDSAGNSTKLSDDEAAYLVLGAGNNLYYSNISDSKNLYKIDTYGNRGKVDDLGKSNAANYVNVSVNSSVAYYSSNDGNVYRSGDPYNPIKISVQTTNGLVTDKIANINVSNGSIYYKSLVDGGKLYKVGANGGVAQKISNDSVDAIFVYSYNGLKDDVYYLKSGKMFMITADSLTGTTLPKPIAITKPKANLKISKIDAIPMVYTDYSDSSKTIDKIDVLRYLPDKIPAIMSDGTIQQVPVKWDITVPKAKNGIYTYSGTVLGYGNKVTINLAIATLSGINSGNTHAYNEVGKNDSVVIDTGALSSGDVVKVYTVGNTSKVAKTATVDATGGVVIGGLDFGVNAGSVKVTVTKPGKAEGSPLFVNFGPERGPAPTIAAWNLANTQLIYNTANDTITIKGIQITAEDTYQVYVGSQTDINRASNDDSNWYDLASTGSNPLPSTYGTYNSSTKILTLNGNSANSWITVPSANLRFGGNGAKVFFRKQGSPASQATSFVINPRIPAPYGITFDEAARVIRGTTDRQQYSLDGGTTWIDCTNNTTSISGGFPNLYAIQVRIKPTQSTLASLEVVQVKVTDLAGTSTNLAITTPATVDDTNGTITNTGNVINLKSSVPVTWRVVDSRGQATNIASIQQTDGTHAVLTGYENGVVNVVATTTDGSNIQGNVNVNITNQPVITVKNTAELANAINSGYIRVIKLVGIGGSYNLNTLPVTASKKLTIIGQDLTSVLNISSNLAAVDGGSGFANLNLKNLTVKGNGANGNLITVSGGSLTLDGVAFDSIKGTSVINQSAGTVTINNSKFLPSNVVNNAVVITSGSITNSYFTGNSNNSSETGAVKVSGSVTLQGNTFTNYNQNNESAIKLGSGFSGIIGGIARDYWNIINNCNIGIDLNGNGVSADTLMTNNSIDVRTITIPIKP